MIPAILKTVARLGLLSWALFAAMAQANPAPLLQLDVAHAGNRLVSVGDRGSILLSDDQGRSWQPAQVPSRQLLTAVYFVDAEHGWAVGHDAQILVTRDAGAHWSLQWQDPDRQAPLLDVWFADLQHGFAVGAYGTLLHTDDGGGHWQDLSDRLDNPDQYHLNAIAQAHGGGLFIVGEGASVFRSLDQGASWQRLTLPYEGSLFGVLALTQPGAVLVYGLRGQLYRTADDGDTWQVIDSGADGNLAGASLLENGAPVLVGSGATVLRGSVDGGSFQLERRADGLALAAVTGTDDGAVVLAGQGGVQRAAASDTAAVQP